jgi:hypothetical protein
MGFPEQDEQERIGRRQRISTLIQSDIFILPLIKILENVGSEI